MSKQIFNLAMRVMLALCLLCFLPARAGFQPYNWLVSVETEEIPGQFQYAGSILQPVVLARISFAKADGSEDTPYETLWLCGGKLFGLERYNALGVDRGQSISIKVTHKTKIPSANDYRAAAKSIVRVFLDVRTHNSMLQSVIVPDLSFTQILNELGNEHFSAFNVPILTPYQLAAAMFMQDESDQHTQTICYSPNSPGN